MAPGLPYPTQQRRGLTGNQTADELIQAHANLSPPAQAAIGMSKIPAIAETNLAPTLPPNAPLVNPAVTEPPSAATTTLAAPSKVRGFGPLPGSPEAARADELHRLETSPPGIVGATNRINNPFLRGLARVGGTVGDVIASGVFPNFGAFVPGTSAHHAVLVNQAANAVRRDQQEQAAEDEQRLREAQAGHLEAETDELGNPKPTAEEFSTVPTSEGIVSFNKRTGAGSPLTVAGKVAQPVEKPEKGQTANVHVLPSGQVIAVHTDPDTGKSTAEVVYEGEPGLKTEVKQIEIGGKPHQVLLNSQTGETIKDLGETGEKPPTVNVNAGIAALDRESTRFAKPYESGIAAANAQLEKIADARAMINGNAESQALGVPKVLTALVSGQGSGVRITQPELNSIARARGISGSLEGFMNQMSGKGQLSAEQKKQLTGILDDVKQRLLQKQEVYNEALDNINGAGSRQEILQHEKTARGKISEIESGASQQQASGRSAQGGYRVGGVYSGMTYLGGDPNQETSWKK